MGTTLTIAGDEWRFWMRSKLGAAAAVLALILVATSLIATMGQISKQRQNRASMQANAEQTFRAQPDRHPHRMVHYGHYVFRTPAPLAALDPGVDPYTGTVMFLEGHRQNSATFSPSYDVAQAGPFAVLTP
ncbi:MAG: delta 1-pyrroline-5-carboxylate reductase, partial [Pseudomonadota bacterium]